MNVTDLLVCGFDGDRVVFSANLTPQGAVTVWSSTDAQGAVTVHDTNPPHAVAGFASFVRVLEDLANPTPKPRAVTRPALSQPR